MRQAFGMSHRKGTCLWNGKPGMGNLTWIFSAMNRYRLDQKPCTVRSQDSATRKECAFRPSTPLWEQPEWPGIRFISTWELLSKKESWKKLMWKMGQRISIGGLYISYAISKIGNREKDHQIHKIYFIDCTNFWHVSIFDSSQNLGYITIPIL